jgi:hypothetical protein
MRCASLKALSPFYHQITILDTETLGHFVMHFDYLDVMIERKSTLIIIQDTLYNLVPLKLLKVKAYACSRNL